MPPKRLVYAQSLRDAFTETDSCAAVENWATVTISRLEQLVQRVAAKRASIQQSLYTRANAEHTPEEVVALLQEYQSICHCVFSEAELIRTVIAIRIPELKEEDNLGVVVQHAVLKMLDELQNKTIGGGGGDKNSGGGVASAAGMYSLRDYLSTRGGLEDKLLGKAEENNKDKSKDNNNNNNNNNEGEKAMGSKSPSLVLELKQVDADTLLKVELAGTQLTSTLRAFVNAYALNWKKLIQPRTGNDHMVS
ncbi:proteasome activator protein PA26 [Trypanosoma theileri]|uniref:Proteasome activator protein PA26 n=1 Tax=Trypanosoma theileri TaxID=67003 RepID=A0A1X0NKN6_9TRYP|nr:proteasome activator protein PA26 [Trypanosoma theileri]ORC84670.1 proteasome activator protein PA26 [Trypanosoma theileri]